MKNNEISLAAAPGGPQIKINKNVLLSAGLVLSFLLWAAAVAALPKRVDSIDARLTEAEKKFLVIESRINSVGEDVRDIKNFLLKEKK